MSTYTFSTWMYANLLYPLVFFFFIGGRLDDVSSGLAFLFPFLFFTILLSLPSLLLSYILMQGIIVLRASADVKFIGWLLSAPVVVIANFIIICFLIFREDIVSSNFWPIVNPAMIAVAVVILLRYKSFYTALNNLTDNQLSKEGEPS